MALTQEELELKELELAKKEQDLLLQAQRKEEELEAKAKELAERAARNPDEELEKAIKDKVEEELKDIKGKLNQAYQTRDEALKVVAEKEAKEREAELNRLKEEGKHKEAYEIQLAEEKAARAALEKQNIELTRDMELRGALTSCDFRNETASEMAFKEIVSELIRNDSNVWVHKSGLTIRDFVKLFSERDTSSFLFKSKAPSGGGTDKPAGGKPGDKPKSLFEMTQEEAIAHVKAGKHKK